MACVYHVTSTIKLYACVQVRRHARVRTFDEQTSRCGHPPTSTYNVIDGIISLPIHTHTHTHTHTNTHIDKTRLAVYLDAPRLTI